MHLLVDVHISSPRRRDSLASILHQHISLLWSCSYRSIISIIDCLFHVLATVTYLVKIGWVWGNPVHDLSVQSFTSFCIMWYRNVITWVFVSESSVLSEISIVLCLSEDHVIPIDAESNRIDFHVIWLVLHVLHGKMCASPSIWVYLLLCRLILIVYYRGHELRSFLNLASRREVSICSSWAPS